MILGSRPGIKNGHPILDEIGLVNDRHALRKIGILRQNAIAVADRENRRNQLDLGPGRGGFHFLHVAEVKVWHAVEDLKLVVGEQNAQHSLRLARSRIRAINSSTDRST